MTAGSAPRLSTPSADGSRQNNFNFLRLVLASLVLLSHSFELVDGDRSREPLTRIFHTISFGELAVDGFFILSGYLIVGSYLGRPEPLHFLRHRLLRIYPGFVACALVCLVIVGRIGSDESYYAGIDLYKFITRLPRLHIDGLPQVFVGTSYPLVDGPIWTLNPEFQCYLLALLCGWVGILRRPLLWLGLGLAAATIYFLHFSGFDLAYDHGQQKIYRDIVRLGMLFVAGGCFKIFGSALRYRPSLALFCAAALALALFDHRVAEPAVAVFGGYLLLYLGFANNQALTVFRRLPDISYGTYLYGWPIQKLLLLGFAAMPPALLFCLSLPLAWVAGTFSWYLVEKPALALR